MSEAETSLQAISRQVQSQLPEVEVTRWQRHPGDDDNLWWFSLPGHSDDVQVEGIGFPFLIETNEQSCGGALKATTAEEAARLIVTYLTSVKEGRPTRMAGALYWPKASETL